MGELALGPRENDPHAGVGKFRKIPNGPKRAHRPRSARQAASMDSLVDRTRECSRGRNAAPFVEDARQSRLRYSVGQRCGLPADLPARSILGGLPQRCQLLRQHAEQRPIHVSPAHADGLAFVTFLDEAEALENSDRSLVRREHLACDTSHLQPGERLAEERSRGFGGVPSVSPCRIDSVREALDISPLPVPSSQIDRRNARSRPSIEGLSLELGAPLRGEAIKACRRAGECPWTPTFRRSSGP